MSDNHDILELVTRNIEESDAPDGAKGIWQSAYMDLERFCDIRPGEIDEYTKDVVLCWVGWVMAADIDTVDAIYDACEGFVLDFKDDDAGKEGSERMYAAIDAKVGDPMSVYRELARDQLHRFQGAAAEASPFKEDAGDSAGAGDPDKGAEDSNKGGKDD